jgi:hypothetical protein
MMKAFRQIRYDYLLILKHTGHLQGRRHVVLSRHVHPSSVLHVLPSH